MLVAGTPNQGGVTGAIRDAASATGTSFDYLVATARVESGLDPNAAASTSSAGGLFQFIDQTWLATLKAAGPSLGYGRYSDAISRTASGRYQVADPTMRQAIMDLRRDPTANATMAGAFTQGNAQRLTEKIGRKPTNGELYMAHFFGAAGAGRLISLATSTPNASAASLFPNAAAANRSIFYDKQGGARSVSQVYGVLTRRFDVAQGSARGVAASVAQVVPSGQVAMPAQAPPAPAARVADAGTAPLQPVERGPGFYSLFSSDRGPVSSKVQDLWGAAPQANASDRSLGNLFLEKRG